MTDFQSIQTFLTLVETHNFRLAAEQLNLTKSAVSARIKQLEQVLQVDLFDRGSDGVRLTPAGQKFFRHAMGLRRDWEKAQKDVRLQPGMTGHISLGIHGAMAFDILQDWLAVLRSDHPDISFNGEADYSTNIVQNVAGGALDIGVIYIAETRPGLTIEKLFDDRLIMMSPQITELSRITADNYLYLDWGAGYNGWHREQLPHLSRAAAALGLASMGPDYLSRHGGAAYLPERLLMAGRLPNLQPVEGAPDYHRSVYVTYPTEPGDPERLKIGLGALRAVVDALPGG